MTNSAHLLLAATVFISSLTAATRFQMASQSPGYSYPSGNFFITLRQTEPGSQSANQTFLVTVAKSLTNRQDILWTNYLRGIQFPPARVGTIASSEDGTFFVVQAESDIWKLVAKDKPSRTLTLGNAPASISWGYSDYDNSFACFDKFNGQPIVRIWRRASDHWQAFFVNEDKEISVTPELTAKWNRDTREEILDKIAEAKTDSLKRKLYEISPTVGNMAIGPQPSFWRRQTQMSHYEFLAIRHVPADRGLFVKLLEHRAVGPVPTNFPVAMRARWGGYSQLTGRIWVNSYDYPPYNYESRSTDRHEGDWLLAVFDQNPKIALRNRRAVDRDLFYLGRVTGSVKLPVPIVKKSGTLRIYLAPASRAGKDWTGDGIDNIEEELIQDTNRDSRLTDRINFIFDTVSPGPVCLKAIWDKRSSFEDRIQAGPGDYESDWTPPINITAGLVTNIFLICNNHASIGGETYYAADEVRARNWRQQADAAFTRALVNSQGKNQIFTAFADKWILKSNYQMQGQPHGLVQISIVQDNYDSSKPPELLAIFDEPTGRNIINPYTLRLHAKDGAKFTPTHTRTSGQYTYATFPDFPRAAETFRLIGYGRPENPTQDHSTNALFDLTLTNLWHTQ